MSEQMWTRRVWLTASGAVELAPGVLLPAGTYSAKWKAPAAGIAPEYVIELTAAAQVRMGALAASVLGLRAWDVTNQVTRGLMREWPSTSSPAVAPVSRVLRDAAAESG